MLHPAGPAAGEIVWLWWFLCAICTAVFVAVMLLTWLAVLRPNGPPQRNSPLGNRFIVISGVAIPAIVLVVILVISLRTQVVLAIPETELTIRVVGHQYWWEVHYPDQDVVTANELYIPVGEAVRLELTSGDVIHSLWVPNLNGKTDLIPDKINVAWLRAERPGIFRGQCAEYCGVQHAWMALKVVALPREEFDAWIEQTRQPVLEPETALLLRGRQVYFEAACHNCHTIRGTAATGRRGPDLTHIASRTTLGAGLFPNNRGNLAGWVTNPQALKPGNLMPPTYLASEDLHALIAYLESLE